MIISNIFCINVCKISELSENVDSECKIYYKTIKLDIFMIMATFSYF